MLCQGLALNDDLQKLLAKHEAIVSGSPVSQKRPEAGSGQALVDVDSPLVDTGESSKQADGRYLCPCHFYFGWKLVLVNFLALVMI